MTKRNWLYELAAYEIVSDGSAGKAYGVVWILILFLLPPVACYYLFYELPKWALKRWTGRIGPAYYRLLGISPKTLERIKRREALRRKGL